MKPKILILGGGYAGVTAAVHLRNARADVTLVNDRNYHYLTTLMHHPAVWHTDYEEVSVHLPTLLSPEIHFLRGTVETISPQDKRVKLSTRDGQQTLAYDYLIVALGWEPQYFDIPGVQQHALVLQNLKSAYLIHNRIELAMIAYDQEPLPKWCNIVIGGGGFTGVELAGEIADWRPHLARTFDLEPEQICIYLIGAAPTVLHGFNKSLIDRTAALLKQKGVNLITGTPIERVEDHCVILKNECNQALDAGVILWAGGVRGHRLIEQSGFAVNRQGRAEVNEFLQVKDDPSIYVSGDCVLTFDAQNNPLPPTAQIAVQHGYCVAKNIKRVLKNQAQEPFQSRLLGTFLSLGRRDALGTIQNRHCFSGWVARTLKNGIAYRYLWSIGGTRLIGRKLWQRIRGRKPHWHS